MADVVVQKKFHPISSNKNKKNNCRNIQHHLLKLKKGASTGAETYSTKKRFAMKEKSHCVGKKEENEQKIVHLCLLDSDIFDKVLAIASI